MAGEFQGQFNEAMREAEARGRQEADFDETVEQSASDRSRASFEPDSSIRARARSRARSPRRVLPPSTLAGPTPSRPLIGPERLTQFEPAPIASRSLPERRAPVERACRRPRPRPGRDPARPSQTVASPSGAKIMSQDDIEASTRAADRASDRAAGAADQVADRLRRHVLRLLLLRQADLQHPALAVSSGLRRRRSRTCSLIYTAPLEYLFTQIKVAVFGAALPRVSRSSRRRSTSSSRPASTRTSATPSCPISSRRRSSSCSARLVVYFFAMPMVMRFSLGMQQAGGDGQRGDRAPAEGQRLSVADHDADLRLRHLLPAAGGPDAARPGRHHRLGLPQGQAPLRHRHRLRHRGGADAARRDQPARRSRCRRCSSTSSRSSRSAWSRRSAQAAEAPRRASTAIGAFRLDLA